MLSAGNSRENGRHAIEGGLARSGKQTGARPGTRPSAAALTCWALVPLKPSPGRKSRLSDVLDADRREVLVSEMAAHVAAAARAARGIDRIAFVTDALTDLPGYCERLRDRGGGLNCALSDALEHIAGRGASRVVVVAADLPLVTAGDLERLAAASADTIALATDRAGTGTNALSLPLPAACNFEFAFGLGSFGLHRAEAARLGLRIDEVRSEGLALDVDTPDDLADAAQWLGASLGAGQ